MGKSTVVTNLSYELAKKGYNVLAVDTDSQSDMSSVLYPDYIEEPDVSFYNAFLGQEDFKEEGYIIHTEYSGIDVVAGSAECEALEGALCMMTDKIRDKMWKKCLRSVREENYYDFIIIDCPPSLSQLTINAMTTADTVLVPIQCEYYALEGLSQLIHTVNLVKERLNPELDMEGVVFTMYDSRTNLSMQVVENVKSHLSQNVYNTVIPRNIILGEAASYGMPINLYDAKSAGAEAYMALADEVINNRNFSS